LNPFPFLLSPSPGYFVTGTDTGAGKTHVCCLLIEALRQKGLRVAAMKPVAAGVDAGGVNEDVRKLMNASNVQADLRDINPYSFVPPIAPHIAAHRAGVEIDLDVIAKSYVRLRDASDVVIVEGAGGFLVPLDEIRDMSAIPKKLDLPVVLVVGMKLGCLNHALLTCEAIASRNLHLAGWIANVIEPSMEVLEANIKTLKSCIHAPFLGKSGWASGATLDISDLLTN
jgi:dethiobiotin synthetase